MIPRTPKLPRGYRWLKVGERRPEGYKFWFGGPDFIPGARLGARLTSGQNKHLGPYIAPIKRAKRRNNTKVSHVATENL